MLRFMVPLDHFTPGWPPCKAFCGTVSRYYGGPCGTLYAVLSLAVDTTTRIRYRPRRCLHQSP